MSDPTGVGLRAIQYAGNAEIDAIYRRLARQVDHIIVANLEWPNGRRKSPVLTDAGRTRIVQACLTLFDGVSNEFTAIIQRAMIATEEMAQRTEEPTS